MVGSYFRSEDLTDAFSRCLKPTSRTITRSRSGSIELVYVCTEGNRFAANIFDADRVDAVSIDSREFEDFANVYLSMELRTLDWEFL